MWKINPFNYQRRPSIEVRIGQLLMGGTQPVRIQSMTNTDTNDIEASLQQCIRLIHAGAELVRFTTQGNREAESLKKIHDLLQEEGYQTPLSADVHFNTNVADVVAQYVEKVRINPGNYLGNNRGNISSNDSDEEYAAEYERIKQRFVELLNICKKHQTALRIGVNHGSLSERIMNRYGDTAEGMVESCMEFLRICREENFQNVVISMKASNTLTMIHSVRMLVERMEIENFHYPLHLGVTEAGNEDEGRIKSAVGIGTLLSEGIGDTIRVSLSEDPEAEIPVARKLISYIDEKKIHEPILAEKNQKHSPFEYRRRTTHAVENIGGNNVPIVIAATKTNYAITPDYYFAENQITNSLNEIFPIYEVNEKEELTKNPSPIKFLKMSFPQLTKENLHFLKSRKDTVIILESYHKNAPAEQKAFFHSLMNEDCTVPVIVAQSYQENMEEDLEIKGGVDFGMLFVEGFGDGISLKNEGTISPEKINSIAFGILQATRARISKTEFISCPGCGRTMFDLQTVVSRIKSRTSHLKGLKIGIMGCIVNGIGEMADADYGYVGAGRGKVSLYKKKDCVEKNIPEEEAVEKLIELIKINGDWTEPNS